jgi:hypothetical protein
VPNDGVGWSVLWCREYRVGEGDLVNGVYSPNTLAKTLSKTLGYTLAKQDLVAIGK